MINKQDKNRIQKKFKIPVDGTHPGTYWIISIDDQSELPTDAELTLLRSFCEFKVKSWFNERYCDIILKEKRLPSDEGQNTITFRKFAEKDWRFRRLTWEIGPTFVPYPFADPPQQPLDLIPLFDRIQDTFLDKWNKWKDDRPELFGPAPERVVISITPIQEMVNKAIVAGDNDLAKKLLDMKVD